MLEVMKIILKDRSAIDCVIYLGSAAIALILWVFNQDHYALGMVIMATCWSWSPSVFFEKHR